MPAYNEIEDQGNYFFLWKNPDLPATDTEPMAFKDLFVEWGQDGPKVKIRRLIYPKDTYTRADIERVAQSTLNCPFCKDGRIATEIGGTGLESYALPHALSIPSLDQIAANLKREWNKFWGLPS